MTPRLGLPILSGLGLIATIWCAAGAAGLGYAVVFAAAVAPGIPLGLALFGRRNPAGWIAGALVGYGTTQLALWAAIAADMGVSLLVVFNALRLLAISNAGERR
jgi:cation transport ATPase